MVANLAISSVPGPQVPLAYLAGARMLTFHPLSIVMHGLALRTSPSRPAAGKARTSGVIADRQGGARKCRTRRRPGGRAFEEARKVIVRAGAPSGSNRYRAPSPRRPKRASRASQTGVFLTVKSPKLLPCTQSRDNQRGKSAPAHARGKRPKPPLDDLAPLQPQPCWPAWVPVRPEFGAVLPAWPLLPACPGRRRPQRGGVSSLQAPATRRPLPPRHPVRSTTTTITIQ